MKKIIIQLAIAAAKEVVSEVIKKINEQQKKK